MFSQLVPSLSSEGHGVKDRGYIVNGVAQRKIGANVVGSVAVLSRGVYSEVAFSLSDEEHGATEEGYMKGVALRKMGVTVVGSS